MEEVPAHAHPGPIVGDVLTRQHKYRSRLIWSGDCETCITDLQCRRFGRSLFQAYSTTPRHMLPDMSDSFIHIRYINLLEDFDAIDTYNWGSCVLGFRGCMTDRGSSSATSNLGLVTYSCIMSSARSACSSRPSCSTWYYVVYI
ncbi:hypothetical protein M9H77_26966 [Catharanthus roseus]|uniref:Uncharacterized protein n=1 Tax=Catharanthus roseus TaxID=4058 RepID=A0ACC0ADV7_CATRO|nr:hypothetical protein M9H77_26966 [Catharanthus roseus]